MRENPRIIRFCLLLSMLALAWAAAPTLAEETENPAEKAFVANKCNMCHSIETLGIERTSTSDKMKAADLSSVGDRHDSEWIVRFLEKETELEGEPHKLSYKGTGEDLAAIADWLAAMRSESESE
jgi:hypothetical protein